MSSSERVRRAETPESEGVAGETPESEGEAEDAEDAAGIDAPARFFARLAAAPATLRCSSASAYRRSASARCSKRTNATMARRAMPQRKASQPKDARSFPPVPAEFFAAAGPPAGEEDVGSDMRGKFASAGRA